MRKWIVIALALFVASLAAAGPSQARADEMASAAALHTTASYYTNTTDPGTLGSLGCDEGAKTVGRAGPQDDLVILVFGAPSQRGGLEGTTLFRGEGDPATRFASTAEIEQGAQAFIGNYFLCADQNAHLSLVLGTSNWGANVTREHGIAWGNMVKDASAWIAAALYTDRATVYGGSDIEADWSRPSVARAWVDGYLSVCPPNLYNFGDAAGCPTSDKASRSCNNGWTLEDLWYVSWGAGGTRPMPQIYNSAQARQWVQIKKYSVLKSDQGYLPLQIAGVLTEAGACRQSGGCPSGLDFTPAQGYAQLSSLLNSDPQVAQVLTYSSDIKKAWMP